MKLIPIEKRSGLTKETFKSEYLDLRKPVVFKDLINDWPAKNKWTFEYLRSNYGDLEVPVFDTSFSKGGKNYMSATGKMKFGDYLSLIEAGPTELRIFLFNIFKHIPELVKDIKIPQIMEGFYNEYPFMFFGGQGAYTKIHYDIDCSHVFLSQFQTRKRVVLFAPEESDKLIRVPYTVGCLVDMINPDEEKFPSLKKIQGYETILEHGETVFIPSQFWHHIEYTEGGYSLSLRANNSMQLKLKGVYNIAKHFMVDRGMNLIMGQKWMDMKLKLAHKNVQLN
ncbi:MAG: cupin-like domain-containing protein [Bacteroidota bacterium]|nr:cupin-like domain-containing protein [Bacteroidota bacterium]